MPVHLGFVPLNDCAPIVMAQELELFEKYVDAPIHALRMSMSGTFNFGHGRVEKDADFHVFARHGANEPTPEKGEWVLQQMCECGVIKDRSLIQPECIAESFRADLFHQARQLIH